MNSQELVEFQYKYGDPRPHFFNYLKTFPNFTTYLDKKITTRNSITLTCIKESKRRSLKLPSNKYKDLILDKIKDSKEPIIILPVILIGKFGCKYVNKSRHLNIILYNKLTHELERIDIRKYHLDGYSLKLFIKILKESFIKKILKDLDPNADLTTDLDLPIEFIKKCEAESARNVFPIFLLSYLTIRNKYPSLTSDQVIKKVLKMNLNDIKAIWDKYAEYVKSNLSSKCSKENLIENPESNRCQKSISLNKLAITKSHIECPDSKVYNPLLEKCVPKNKIVDVNILLDDILSTQKSKEKELSHIMEDVSLILGAFSNIMSKYPHAKILFYKRDKKKNVKKKDLRIGWMYNATEKNFRLELPYDFWDLWEDAMNNPQIRFIISFVSLRSSEDGQHANVLIYDKDTNEMERFDGLGRDINELYNIKDFDEEIVKIFPKSIKYFTPLDFCPKFPVFQSKEIDEIPGKDLRGNCAVWRLWYINLRLANPQIDRKNLVLLAAKKLEQTGSLYKFIKGYQKYLLDSIKKQRFNYKKL